MVLVLCVYTYVGVLLGYGVCIHIVIMFHSHSLVLTHSQHTLTGYSALPGLLMGIRLHQAVKLAR